MSLRDDWTTWQIGDLVLEVPGDWRGPTFREDGQCAELSAPDGDPTLLVRSGRWRGAQVPRKGIVRGLAVSHLDYLGAMGFAEETSEVQDLHEDAEGVVLLVQLGLGTRDEAGHVFAAVHAMYPGGELLTLHVGGRAALLDLERAAQLALGFLGRVRGFVDPEERGAP